MGAATTQQVRTLHNTGRGTDVFGRCECCRKPVGEHWVSTPRRVYVREDGQKYLSGGYGIFGHRECLLRDFGAHVDQAALPHDGRVSLLPEDEVLPLVLQ